MLRKRKRVVVYLDKVQFEWLCYLKSVFGCRYLSVGEFLSENLFVGRCVSNYDISNCTRFHDLKISCDYFDDVRRGYKTFEVRYNDRKFKVGDVLLLREVNKKGIYTKRELLCEVSYLLDDEKYCKDGYVVLGISGVREVKENE